MRIADCGLRIADCGLIVGALSRAKGAEKGKILGLDKSAIRNQKVLNLTAASRKAFGVIPVASRKILVKWLWLA